MMKFLGAFSRFMRPKTKLFSVKYRRILEVLCLQGLRIKFWAHFHDLCVQKRSCLPWSSGAFWKFSPCEVYKKSSGRIITIFASNNEAVCCWVQTDFGILHIQGLQKISGCIFTICASKNEAVCLRVQTHFRSSLLASFAEKVLGAYSRFMRRKTKLFAVKFRRILEVLRIQGLQKDFWAHFHDLCVQKRSCLLWSSDGFWKFSPCKLYEVLGAISQLMRPKI